MASAGRLLVVAALLLQAGSGAAWAQVSTDQEDYAPGSYVTISGDAAKMQAGQQPYADGETVHVEAVGPRGIWTDECDATVIQGAWSCKVHLSFDPAVAIGDYTYTAVSIASDGSPILEKGTFTDGGANVSGKVRSSAGTPLADATVTCTVNCTNSPALVAYTGADGAFALSNLTFQTAGPKTLTLVARKAGFADTTLTVSVSNNKSYTLDFVLTDNTPPVVTPTLLPVVPDGSNGWYKKNVSITWSVTDGQSGIQSSEGCGQVTVSADGTTSYTCSATSTGGTTERTVEIKHDATAPSGLTWTGGPVSGVTYDVGAVPAAPTCSATDATSGLESCVVTGYAITAGAATMTATATDKAGNVMTDTRSYTVKVPDSTGPVITASLNPAAADGTSGWYRKNVTLTWSVTDPDSAVSAKDGCDTATVNADGSQAFTCAATSAGGTSSTTVTVKRDATAPTDLTWTGGIADGASYQEGSVPAAPTCTAADATSGLLDCVVTGYSTAIGAHELTGTATDKAGNVTIATRPYTVQPLDKTAPVITAHLDPATPNGQNGWYSSGDVTLTWDVSDAESEITSTTGCEAVTVSADEAIDHTCSATSEGGTASQSTTIKRDSTGPADIAWVGDLSNDAHVTFGSVPAVPTCSATDATSGLAGCEVSGYSTEIGSHTLTATATDKAGNSSTATLAYTVDALTVTCSVFGYSGTYDGAAHGASGACKGIDGVAVKGLTFEGPNSFTDASTNSVHWTFTAPNYASQSGDATVSIGKAAAVCEVSGYAGIYDGNAHGASGSCHGVNGEDLKDLNLGDSFTSAPGGDANWTFAGGVNYGDQSGAVKIQIDQAAALCDVAGSSDTFDGTSHGASGSCVDLTGQTLPGLALGDSFTDAPGGTAHWTFSGTTNYAPQEGDVTINIRKADATCTVTGYSGTYDAANHGAKGVCTGVGGVELAGLDLGESFTNAAGGTANWTFSGAKNYNDASGEVTIEIAKADPACTVSGYAGTFDASEHGASGACTGAGGAALEGLQLGDSFTDAPGGTATWTIAETQNYTSQTGTVQIDIAKADAACTVNGYAGTYDATSHGASGSCTGVHSEDLSTGLSLGASFTDAPGGTANWTFSGQTNYNDTSGTANVEIIKADATCTVTGFTGTYDGKAHSASGSCVGVNSADLSSGLSLGDAFVDATGGTATWTFSGGTNYNNQVGTASIVIDKADASCTVTGFIGTYDGKAHSATGSCSGVGVKSLAGLSLGSSFTDAPGGSADWTFLGGTNYNDQSGKAAIVINRADASCKVTGFTGTYDGKAHSATGSCLGLDGATLGGLTLGSSFTNVPGGTADWAFAGSTNYNEQLGSAAIVIYKATVNVTPEARTAQYSDPTPALTFAYGPFVTGENAAVVDTAPVCTTTRTTSSAPGAYPITCTGGIDGNYSFAYTSGTFTVTPELARVTYTGPTFLRTASATTGTVGAPLSVTIQDITAVGGDPDAGDIRDANVTFLVDDKAVCTSKVSLVNASDPKTGTAGCTYTAGTGGHTVAVSVGGNYVSDGEGDAKSSLEVALGGTTNAITGGGWMPAKASAGAYPASPGSRMNFGFNVTYNKAMTNLQGHVNLIYRNGGRTYQLKSNAISSLNVSLGKLTTDPSTALFLSKANLVDITNPLSPIAIAGGVTLTLSMTDKGEPGTSDTIGLSLSDGGRLLFSSNWTGTTTAQSLLSGGNLVVR